MSDASDQCKGMGIPSFVCEEFAAEHEGRLAGSPAELESWGNRTGRRASTGAWTSKPVSSGDQGTSGSTAGGATAPTGDLTQQIMAFIQANPLPVAVVVAVLLLRRR